MSGDAELLTETELRPAVVALGEWRQDREWLRTAFACPSAAAALQLIAAIGEAAEGMNHHPDVDWRYDHVFVSTSSHDVGGLTRRDLNLARQISVLADAADAAAHPEKARPGA